MPKVTAPSCRPDSPVMCKGRAEAPAPGVWCDPDTRVWYWADLTGMMAVTHCPYCKSPLPLMGTTADTLRLIQRALDEPLADPEE